MVFHLLSALFFVALATPALGDEVADKAQCRLSVGNSIRRLTALTSIRAGLCHSDRIKQKVSAGVDCNDPWSWDSVTYEKGEAQISRALQRFAAQFSSCSGPITTTAEVGYVDCPAPCEALPVATFPELGACVECIARDATSTHLDAIVGTPLVGGAAAALRCQSAVIRNASRYLHKRKMMQHDCEFLAEIGTEGFVGVDCVDIGTPGHPYADRVNRYRARVIDQVQRSCAGVDLATNLDLCDDDPAAVGACVADLIEAWSAQLQAATHPPLP